MKASLLIASMLLLAGCYKSSGQFIYPNGNKGESYEICYNGQTYVRFSSNENSWGGVMLTPEGKPVPCK